MLRSTVIAVGIMVLFIGFLLIIGGVESKTITVDDDGEADYLNIQDAINNATKGDTIRVWEGLYKENVVVNKTASLVGNGSTTTIIEGRGEESTIEISADWVYMGGFQMLGSVYGIKIKSNNNTIENNICSNNYKGIILDFSINNTIKSNICSSNEGSGLYLSSSNNNIIVNNTCSNNNDVGIWLDNSSINTITSNTCLNNSLVAFRFDESDYNTIVSNTCSNNAISIYLSYSGNNTILSNNCSNSDYGINLRLSSNNNDIVDNHCSNTEIGIFLLFSCNNNTIKRNICSNNHNGSSVTYSNGNKIEKNTFTNNQYYGIRFLSSSYNIIVNNSIFENTVGIIFIKQNEESKFNIVHSNNIFDNIEFGIKATDNGGFKINATNNWWGDPSGPFHSVNNSIGRGDKVTDGVGFNPWRDDDGNLVYLPDEGTDDNRDYSWILFFLAAIIIILVWILCMLVVSLHR